MKFAYLCQKFQPNMKKIMDLRIVTNTRLGDKYVFMVLTPTDYQQLPAIEPGQFVNIAVPNSKTTFLRRPISVNRVSRDGRELHLLIRLAGDGTRALAELLPGDMLNVVLPLGNTFPMDGTKGKKVLLIGGGVGVAPLLYYGERLKADGAEPVFLLGARTADDLLLLGEFDAVAPTCLATEDGSLGVKGFVTDSPVMANTDFDMWVCCGPSPMMKAVAAKARQLGIDCYVSLENMMACGVGACLCCVEKTVRGNVCVCTNGPVFNINELTW